MSVEKSKEKVDYLDAEVNLFKPATPFMKDMLFIIWTTFAVWLFFVFGMPTIIWLTGDAMGIGPLTQFTFMGFPFHYWVTAQGSPTVALILCLVFCIRLDKLNQKYGVDE